MLLCSPHLYWFSELRKEKILRRLCSQLQLYFLAEHKWHSRRDFYTGTCASDWRGQNWDNLKRKGERRGYIRDTQAFGRASVTVIGEVAALHVTRSVHACGLHLGGCHCAGQPRQVGIGWRGRGEFAEMRHTRQTRGHGHITVMSKKKDLSKMPFHHNVRLYFNKIRIEIIVIKRNGHLNHTKLKRHT